MSKVLEFCMPSPIGTMPQTMPWHRFSGPGPSQTAKLAEAQGTNGGDPCKGPSERGLFGGS